jgi:3-oxoacyl-[acyl-carrier protein] reductase
MRVLVSGAGAPGGIGIAIAKSHLKSGATVFITSTTDRIHLRAKELGVTGFVADLTQPDQCKSLIDAVGKLDVLVNNAGMTSVRSPLGSDEAASLTEITSAAWERGIKRNLDTAFNLTKAALPKLRNSKSGRIVMISSVTGGLMAMAHQPVYAAAKAAMIGLTRAVALDEAKFGITCNAVLPGWIATDTQNAHESAQGAKTPLGRSGTPEEIAGLVSWLTSESAGFMTGQALVMDGGNSIVEERN